ncbi:MAG: hypothetical protein ACI8PZ_006657 [Myxococcota bacterium]|jgi:hypothetical protein
MPRLLLILLVACGGGDKRSDDTATPTGAVAIVDSDRPEHYFDVPFPSDALLDASTRPDLTGFPTIDAEPIGPILGGWVDRIEQVTAGFGNNTAAYFRFTDALDLPTALPGTPDDPVVWVALDGSEQLPLELRFVADPQGDPFYASNTLAVAPALGHPMRSGGTYAAVVLTSSGASPAPGWTVDPAVTTALDTLGISGEVAVATTFTVHDATGDLRAFAADVDTQIRPSDVIWREVVRLAHTQGETPSGQPATLATVTYLNGDTRTAYLGPMDDEIDHTVELDASWPMAVYEAELETWNYQGLADRPYMSAGFLHVTDVGVHTGWIDGDPPEAEPMRIVLSLPRGADGKATAADGVVMFDHGTGGHAYNIVQRRRPADLGIELATRFASNGWATISRDAPLYGTRYPLIDEGHGPSLGFYNIVNAPAFRDNQRQTVIDGHVLLRFVQDRLAAELPAGSVNTSRIRRMGHSLGSVTSNMGLAMDPDAYEAALLTGTGGIFTLYALHTGLLDGFDPDLVAGLFGLFGAEAPDEITPTNTFGAVFGLPPEAWDHVDRLHPAVSLFQWQMDPSDPMSVVRDEAVPTHMVIAPGDYQTPDFTAEALANAHPDAVTSLCNALGDYDPHSCMWRESEGWDTLDGWLAE